VSLLALCRFLLEDVLVLPSDRGLCLFLANTGIGNTGNPSHSAFRKQVRNRSLLIIVRTKSLANKDASSPALFVEALVVRGSNLELVRDSLRTIRLIYGDYVKCQQLCMDTDFIVVIYMESSLS
jgi:hypothetical protein